MTSTVFVDQQTAIMAAWLNDVNGMTYVTVPALSTSVAALGISVAGKLTTANNLSELAASAATARANIGAQAAGSYALSGVNTDITSLASPALAAATATTQSRADSSTKVATTAMVQSVGIHTSGLIAYSASSNASSADAGKVAYLNAATAQIITLPSTASMLQNDILSYTNINGTGSWTIVGNGTNLIFAFGASGVSSIILSPGDSVQLITDGTNWMQVTGSKSIGVGQVYKTFSASLATVYTNTSGKPYDVMITLGVTGTPVHTITIDGIVRASQTLNSSGLNAMSYQFTVPHLSTWRVDNTSATITYCSTLS
jgi:hypothetical protein